MTTATETDLERTVREEQEAHEAAEAEAAIDNNDGDEPIVDEGGQTAIVDRSQYEREDLQIPRVGDLGVDKIRIKFSGSVMLDRSDPADVALFNRLKFGADAELRVSGSVKASGGTFATNREGDLDAVVSEKTIAVDSVWVLTPEQLG